MTPARLLVITTAFVLFACEHQPLSRDFVTWTLEDEIAAHRERAEDEETFSYELVNLNAALKSPEYRAFLSELSSAPAATRALIYYEARAASGHFMFALATDDHTGCHIIVSSSSGVDEGTCESIPVFREGHGTMAVPVRDPATLGLVQFHSANQQRLLSEVPFVVHSDENLFDRIARTYTRENR